MMKGGKTTPLYFNTPCFTKGPSPNCDLGDIMVLVDGKQRLTALLGFLNDEVRAFGQRLTDFPDSNVLIRRVDVLIAVGQYEREVDLLSWYWELNTTTVAHTEDELLKVSQK